MDEEVKLPRVPPAVGGIDVNFCKNPRCFNFGRPVSRNPQPKGKLTEGKERDTYTIVAQGKDVPALHCTRCKEKPTIKSNRAIHEELTRFLEYLEPQRSQERCPNPDCANSKVSVFDSPKLYRKHGYAASGGRRYLCKACKKTFVFTLRPMFVSTLERQTVHKHKNISIFRHLVNETSMSRLCVLENMTYRSLQEHVDFIHRQCRLFTAERERQLLDMDLGERYLAVDRQDYVVNWSRRIDRRNVTLHGIGTADFATSYVFGMHLDYDHRIDQPAVEYEAAQSGDLLLPLPFRKYARLWMQSDYTKGTKPPPLSGPEEQRVVDTILDAYDATKKRDDVEVFDVPLSTRKLPTKGAQIHAEYTIHGHFHYLKHLLRGAKRVVFYMDQESGIRAACHSAFEERIRLKQCDAFYVRINKTLTIDQKRMCEVKSKRALEEFVAKNPRLADLWPADVRIFYIKELLDDREPLGPWNDEWLDYPFPTRSEPEKSVCWLTDLNVREYTQDDLAELFERASLHPIDRFFAQLRALVKPLSRSIFPASGARRVWHKHAPYDPYVITQLLDIYRTYYNFIKTSDGKKRKGKKPKDAAGTTPAMRLGLAKGPVRFEDIVYYRPPV